jgi:type I restriction enzyme M protein
VTLYGQEKDAATAGLAQMNMILRHNPTALIYQGNTLANPLFKDSDTLKTFDYVVANPPSRSASVSQALDQRHRPAQRPLGPLQTLRHSARQADVKDRDYAYLLHIIRVT